MYMTHSPIKLPPVNLKAPSESIRGGSQPIKGLIEATLGLAVFSAIIPLLQR